MMPIIYDEDTCTRDGAASFEPERLKLLDPNADAKTMAYGLMHAANGRLRYCPENTWWYERTSSGRHWAVMLGDKDMVAWMLSYAMKTVGEIHYQEWKDSGTSRLSPEYDRAADLRDVWKKSHKAKSPFVREMIKIIMVNPEWHITKDEARK